MKNHLVRSLITLVLISLPQFAFAQHPPAIGYMFPPGGQPGQTIEVILGGYDWTPDMQLFAHDRRIHFEIIGSPGPVLVPEPPYWFGKKARRSPEPLPRETKARLTIPADVLPGIVKWQAANANGATSVGKFVVNDTATVVEAERLLEAAPQQIESLPVCISGQIRLIREVDHYRITATKSGPITCSVNARSIGSQLSAVVEIRDQTGRIIAEAADTAGDDTAFRFRPAQRAYSTRFTISTFAATGRLYQLTVTPGPRVVTAIPAVGRRGETREVELMGYGIATGLAKLESVMRDVTFPDDTNSTSFRFQLKTEHGDCPGFPLHLSDETQLAESVSMLTVPSGVTGVLDQRFGEDRYQISGKKGDVWAIEVSHEKTGSLVDAALAIFDHEGKQLARNDDRTGSTDAEMEFPVPADGDYHISVADVASKSGTRAATYHLSVRLAAPDFRLSIPELLNAPIGGKAALAINVTRRGGFAEAIDVAISGLPVGVTVPEKLQVAANQNALTVELTVAADAAASAALVEVIGTATISEKAVQRTTSPVLIATTMKPPFSIDAEGQDDVTKWPRGSTFPAPVLIARDAGFEAEIMLEMTSLQGRHVQGITGPELVVPPGTDRILYPVYLPEWLETTRTARMVVNGVSRVADPGNLRYSVSHQKTRMGFLPTGALLKISAGETEFQAKPGGEISIPIHIDRSEKLTERVTLELCCPESQCSLFIANPQDLAPDVTHSEFTVSILPSALSHTEHPLKIRARLMKDGAYPVISETMVLVELVD
ncbi:MAG: PPC domain-containing protein [Planctomycetaceae bacterium]